ncbi:hypothetical protein RhiirB3_441196 [Rhizophagus irregularis]|nr:hypothetical protein RhiirB3_441196 [Rhizophagus irregularis]
MTFQLFTTILNGKILGYQNEHYNPLNPLALDYKMKQSWINFFEYNGHGIPLTNLKFVWIKIRKVNSKDRTTSVSFACDRSGIYKPKKVADILNREIKGAKSATIQIGSHQLKETFDEISQNNSYDQYRNEPDNDASNLLKKIISLKQDDDPLWFIDSFTANNNLTRIMWMTPKQINLFCIQMLSSFMFIKTKYQDTPTFKLNGDLLNKHDVARQYLTDNLYPMHTTWEKRYINHVFNAGIQTT